MPRAEFQDLLKKLDEWPDFFEKSRKKVRESDGVLGILYRDLSNEKYYKELIQN